MTKGNCFVAAYKTLSELHRKHKGVELHLVHGFVTRHVDGLRHVHAWVELNEALVFDFSNGGKHVIPRVMYYNAGEITEAEVSRYTYGAVLAEMLTHEHYGPWAEMFYPTQEEKTA